MNREASGEILAKEGGGGIIGRGDYDYDDAVNRSDEEEVDKQTEEDGDREEEAASSTNLPDRDEGSATGNGAIKPRLANEDESSDELRKDSALLRTDADILENKNGREELQNDEQDAEKRQSEHHSLERESFLKEASPEDEDEEEANEDDSEEGKAFEPGHDDHKEDDNDGMAEGEVYLSDNNAHLLYN